MQKIFFRRCHTIGAICYRCDNLPQQFCPNISCSKKSRHRSHTIFAGNDCKGS